MAVLDTVPGSIGCGGITSGTSAAASAVTSAATSAAAVLWLSLGRHNVWGATLLWCPL